MTILPYVQTRWNLHDLFPGHHSHEVKDAFETLEARGKAFEASRELLTADIDPATFLELIRELESINHLAHRLFAFAGLWFSEDTQNQAAQSLQAKVQKSLAQLTNHLLFFSLWWKALDDANAERLMAAAGDYRYWLEEMRHYKPYTLSEPEEKIINIKNVTGAAALNRLYTSITNRYVFTLEIDGEIQELTRDALMVYVRGHDPDLRAAAYQELYRVYSEDGPILGQVYQTLVQDWRNEHVELRGYESPISVRNLANDIPDDVVDTLLDVAQENVDIFQRFFLLKARLLELHRLRRYDIYAPVAESDKTYTFEQAVNMVFDAFSEFDPHLTELAQRVFEQQHIDSEVRRGKRGGAFCWSATPDKIPWVLVNYQGRANDVSTLAHELGHAIHTMLASDHTLFTYHASLPLAETASTFGEMLLVDHLLSLEKDEEVRRDILFSQVDDNYATILRQAFFALFERQAHDMIAEGAAVDELSSAYMDNLRLQFGDAVELSDEFRWEWVSIPHMFHTPFYVYAYAFGQLLVLSLYQQFKEEGEAFKPRYLDILAAGGSDSPTRILTRAGIDIHRRDFWQGGFDILDAMVTQLEELSTSMAG